MKALMFVDKKLLAGAEILERHRKLGLRLAGIHRHDLPPQFRRIPDNARENSARQQ